MNKLITVKVFSNRIDAEVSKGFLKSNNIESMILADDAGGMKSFPMSPVFGVKLQVVEKDFQKATSLLNNK